MSVILDTKHLKKFIDEKDFKKIAPAVEKAHTALHARSGRGREYTGWLDLPQRSDGRLLGELSQLGAKVRKNSDALISIGIGGSYLGIRSSLEFLIRDQKLPVHFAGHNLSAGYLTYLCTILKDKRITTVVISKSGTTTEPALAFRLIKQFMQQKYTTQELRERIICITDRTKGALRTIAHQNGYRTYPIDDDIGGRFSVLTPVGLVPLAIAGIDIAGLMAGARAAQQDCALPDVEKNISCRYAAARFLLYKQGKGIEVLSTFYQRCMYIAEWWKQLFGESEGKDGKGIFPASLVLTSDLHSMGQLMQDGMRNIFETFLMVEDPGYALPIPAEKDDTDTFNYVAGKDLEFVNKQAYVATARAHYEGGVPNMTVTVPKNDAYSLGYLYYFFEKAVALSGYLLGVNPFDQPGVEAYKKKMFELLGKK